MMDMGKVHMFDYEHDKAIPSLARYHMHCGTLCGYQRRRTTTNKEDVTCHWCLRIMRSLEKYGK